GCARIGRRRLHLSTRGSEGCAGAHTSPARYVWRFGKMILAPEVVDARKTAERAPRHDQRLVEQPALRVGAGRELGQKAAELTREAGIPLFLARGVVGVGVPTVAVTEPDKHALGQVVLEGPQRTLQ